MKKRWFVVILTIGLLLHVLPLSVLALSPDPITDADGTLLGWSDLSTVSDVLDDSPEQQLAVVNADNDEEAADDRSAGNLTPKTPDEELEGDAPADDTGSTTAPPVCARSTRSTIRTTTPDWTMQSLPRRMVIRSTC